MNNPIIKRIATTLLAVLLLFYIGYQIYNANYSSVKTEVAEYVSADDPGTADTVQVDGFVVRKETVLTQDVSGVVSYTVEDGGRVYKNGIVGEVFQSQSDASAKQKVAILDKQIADLEKLASAGNIHISDQETLRSQAQAKLCETLQDVIPGDFSSMQEKREELLYLLSERQIVIGEAENFDSRVQELKAQRDYYAAAGQSIGQITSPQAGTFISEADGYESLYTYDTVMEIMPDQFDALNTAAPLYTAGSIGKICEEYTWYFVCAMEPADALKFLKGTSVTMNFPFVTNQDIPAEVVAFNQPDRNQKAAIIFECNRMNPEIASLRKETCQISADQYSGIRVSQKAIHFETITKTTTDADGNETTVTKEVKGVYILHGTEIRFRQIVPLFSTSSYVICKQYPDEEDGLLTEETVQMFDEVVVEGTDLYDGKIVK